MKLRDLTDISREDILDRLGLESKSSTSAAVIGTLGLIGLGLVVGAAGALLLAPKAGRELRSDLNQKVRSLRSNGGSATDLQNLEGV